MEDLKSATLRTLRELARKYLGKGHSKLKTRSELLDALAKKLPKLFGSQATEEPAAKPKTKKQAAAAKPKRRVATKIVAAKQPVVPSRPQAKVASSRPARSPHPAEPLVEGFFVARVAGEKEARRHHLTEETGHLRAESSFDEGLGDLPASYGGDLAVLLPRDPRTLFFFWEFREQTVREAFAGLKSPRTILRVLEGDRLIREVDFALESKSFYLHDLEPARPYRIEVYAAGEGGALRLLWATPRSITLPPEGPSSDLSFRTWRLPWDVPTSRAEAWVRQNAGARREGIAPGHLETSRAQAASSPALARWSPTPSGQGFSR